MNPIAKALLSLGATLIVLGLLWQFGGQYLHLGKLPGDIAVEKPNFKFYFPITSSIILSLLLSLLLYVIRLFSK